MFCSLSSVVLLDVFRACESQHRTHMLMHVKLVCLLFTPPPVPSPFLYPLPVYLSEVFTCNYNR